MIRIRQKSIQAFGIQFALVLAGLMFISIAQAQPQYTGFKDTDALLEQARELQAEILAPKSYATAGKEYDTARSHAGSGRLDRATKYIVKANASLRESLEAAKIAAVVFESSLAARERAMEANASGYEPALWMEAESMLTKATLKLENGNARNSSSDANRAAKAYGIAELAAIKTGIVGNARILIAEAEANPDKVERNAPITLGQARALVAQAEAELDINRYETAEPQALAAEAEYQAKHAMYLASQVALLVNKRLTAEELILQWEKPLRDIAGVLSVTTDMSNGYAAASEAALGRATTLVKQDGQKNVRINALESELNQTEVIVQQTARVQSQFQQVQSAMRDEPAQVLRQGDDLVLRLVGLNFSQGQSAIETQYFSLLAAVQNAIRVYPEAYIIVAGHTDSIGEEDDNLVLSQQRANAVRAYLIANSGIAATRISAEGFGETRPIASNTYERGRLQNQRIDIVLQDVQAQPSQSVRAMR